MKKHEFNRVLEVLIALVLIWSIIRVIVPKIANAKHKADDLSKKLYINSMVVPMIDYHIDNGQFPDISDDAKIWDCSCATFYSWFGSSLENYWYPQSEFPNDLNSNSSFSFCGQEISWWQYIYCKIDGGFLLATNMWLKLGNTSYKNFNETWSITEHSKKPDIIKNFSETGWDLYIYCH